ncbi:MAG: glycoside hydrolase family 2 TIM barrel-domain containing protein [Rikenellaceae bacterium]
MKYRAVILTLLSLFLTLTTLNAREIYPLNSGWRVFSAKEGSADAAYNISLPYCWTQSLSTAKNLTTATYLRNLYVPDSWRMQRIFVKFYGVQSVADLFVNGKYVGEHRGGGTAFAFEISKYLKYNDDNSLSLIVNSAPQSDLLPTSIEHDIQGGVYRDVELIVTPQIAISPIFYGSDGLFVTAQSVDSKAVSGEVEVRFVSDAVEERRVELSIENESGEVQFNRTINKSKIDGNTPLVIPFSIKGAKLWSPAEPNLYQVTVSIYSMEKGDKQIEEQTDRVSVTTGFRAVTLAEEQGADGVVRINGEPIFMRGVTLYHDHPVGGGVLSKRSYSEDLEVVKELGANAIRSAIHPHDSYLYSLCDREGIVAWVDTPFVRSPYFSDIAYFPTQRFEENGLEQLREVIYQNYNHPSVVMWGVFSMLNSRGDNFIRYLSELNTTAKSIDKSRLTVALSNQNGDMNNIPDLIVWRQDIGWDKGRFNDIDVWRDKLHSEWSSFRSGVMYGEGGVVDHQINRDDIALCRTEERVAWFPEGRQSAMHEEYAAALNDDPKFWGIWMPALFDFKSSRSPLGEKADGLVSFNRIDRKDAFYLYRALWNKEQPTLHIADRRARHSGTNNQTLRVYASDSVAPVVYIGDTVKSMKMIAPSQFVLEDIKVDNSLNVVVRHGDMVDSVELIYDSPLRARER